MQRIGIDVGGTFTDLVAVDDIGATNLAKVPSTPAGPLARRPRRAEQLADTLELDRAALLAQTERIVHGTTVATNALLERKGARLGLLTTEGHRDVIEMREGLKDDRYNLRMPPPEQLVPRRSAPRRARAACAPTAASKPRSTPPRSTGRSRRCNGNRSRRSRSATCTPSATRGTSDATARGDRRALPGAYVSLSSEVLPQIKEFERVSTTVVNAYVGPALSRYLARLEAGSAKPAMRSDPDHPVAWRRRADRRSRPARGWRRAVRAGRRGRRQRLCRAARRGPNLIPFDMGGTSTDICLVVGGRGRAGR